MEKTTQQYTKVMNVCREIFTKKTFDYGTSWRILRQSSLTDQIFIKANRIRTIQDTGENKVGESIEDAFSAMVNYCVMAIIQGRYKFNLHDDDLTAELATEWYDLVRKEAFNLMESKNHDYGEAWRDMRVSSLTDLILAKILRIKNIEDNKGVTVASEGAEGNYFDMLNYSVFALIHLSEEG
ncbi:MAG: DUF1599 domain-containing protein [Crocinitomicaceae bacterium]|jgi:hypothetical protein|nr:DUF1599 domain-containing protein [Crocinitomicaceae bacterium]